MSKTKTKPVAINLGKLLSETKKIVYSVGNYAAIEFKRFQKSNIKYKSNSRDLVSFVDEESERKLVSRLLKLTPEASVIGEENTHPPKKTSLTWIIDPIDGTTNFVHGIPLFCISVGLMKENRIILGVVYNPISDEMFYATNKSPAMLNQKKIICSHNTQIDKSIISIGVSLAGKSIESKENQDWFFSKVNHLLKKCRALRGIGSAALSLCWVAAGRMDAYCEKGLNSWDIAGGALIVKQAGGKVTNFNNGQDFLFAKEMIAAGNVHQKLLTLLTQKN